MENEQYYKAITENGSKYYKATLFEEYNQFIIEDLENFNSVHFDGDTSWHFHTYDIDFIDNYQVDQLVDLLKSSDTFKNSEAFADIIDLMDEATEEGFEVEVDEIKELILQASNYRLIANLYEIVNNDKNNGIVALVVGGYSQGDACFIWYDNNGLDLDSNDFQQLLYNNFCEIEEVDQEGESLELLNHIAEENVKDFMKKEYNADPTELETFIKIK